MAATGILRNDADNNRWNGNILIKSANTSGEHVHNTTGIPANNSTLILAGKIYGLDSTNGGNAVLNDLDRARTSRGL